jgi:hypothetical protein
VNAWEHDSSLSLRLGMPGASTQHALPAGNMLWRNIGIALGQRLSAHEKLKLIIRRVVEARDGGTPSRMLSTHWYTSSRSICGTSSI